MSQRRSGGNREGLGRRAWPARSGRGRSRALRSFAALLAIALLACLATGTERADNPEGLPQGGSGLAAKYPGDVDIEKDPAVIFAEGFGSGEIPTVDCEQMGGFFDLHGYPGLMHVTDKEAVVGEWRPGLAAVVGAPQTPRRAHACSSSLHATCLTTCAALQGASPGASSRQERALSKVTQFRQTAIFSAVGWK